MGLFQQRSGVSNGKQSPAALSTDTRYMQNTAARERSNADTSSEISCMKRFCKEISPFQPWFVVKDANGRVIDIPESFAPPSLMVFLWKTLPTAACIFTLVYGITDIPTPPFYFAYITNWGVIFCVVYACMSLLNTTLASRTGQPTAEDTVGWRIRITWIAFSVCSYWSFIATALYWPLIFDPHTTELSYLRVVPHGGLFCLVLIDGFIINRIPLRLAYWSGVCLPLTLVWCVWSVIHAQTNINNPNKSDMDPDTNDDAIYPGVVEWNSGWETPLTYCAMTTFVAGPIVYLILWTISLGYCGNRRKYIDSVDARDVRPTVDDVEEGSIFAKWR